MYKWHLKETFTNIQQSDVSDVTTASNNKFMLKVGSDVLQFESVPVDRDSWVATIKTKVAEAKEAVESITSSEGYKATLEKLGMCTLTFRDCSCTLTCIISETNANCSCQGPRV